MVTRPGRANGGFSLLQLLIAIAIIAILAVLVAGAVGGMRRRAHRVQCMANLQSLHAATELYRQQREQWPQVLVDTSADDSAEQYAQQWIAALEPFGISRKTWICPEIQQLLGNPDYNEPDNVRVDYFAMPFDSKPLTPHEWPRQPWFVERGNAHGNGQLIIFADGSISDLGTVIKEAQGR